MKNESSKPRPHPLARKALAAIEPYVPGRSAEDVRREFGLASVAKLGSNENPLGVSPKIRGALLAAIDGVHQYPDPTSASLRRRVAARFGVTPEHVCVANGVDNVLTCLGLAFLDTGDRCVIGAPTYSAYASLALMLNAIPVQVPVRERDWRLDLPRMAGAAANAKMVIVCNPNNPTGTIVTHDEVEAFLRSLPATALAVLDEAYAEFADDPAFPDSAALVGRYPNLIVLRTFSKIYGLAGLRVGYAVAAPDIIACFNQVREPFPVDRLAQAAAEATLDDEMYVRTAFENNRTGRVWLASALADLGLRSIPTQANFVLVELGRPAADVARQLLRHGVIIRPGAMWGLPDWARITVGTTDENRRVVESLKAVLAAS
ncbi:MAG TPA: histidinol-phosphate transaminase [bacterium]|nr:histidinol-phosphate transaminase [bacterium]